MYVHNITYVHLSLLLNAKYLPAKRKNHMLKITAAPLRDFFFTHFIESNIATAYQMNVIHLNESIYHMVNCLEVLKSFGVHVHCARTHDPTEPNPAPISSVFLCVCERDFPILHALIHFDSREHGNLYTWGHKI